MFFKNSRKYQAHVFKDSMDIQAKTREMCYTNLSTQVLRKKRWKKRRELCLM